MKRNEKVNFIDLDIEANYKSFVDKELTKLLMEKKEWQAKVEILKDNIKAIDERIDNFDEQDPKLRLKFFAKDTALSY